jgi:VanZ family protein
MITILRIFAWLLAASVTFATLGPPELRPHSNLGQDGEHTLAFILVGLAFALAYQQHRPRAAGLSVILIGILELLQLLVPGRHARLEDFIVDALATLTGFAIVGVMDWAVRSHWHAKP